MIKCRQYIRIFGSSNILLLLSAMFLVLSSTSCSHKQDLAESISNGFKLVQEGKYEEAQIKALEANEFLTDETPMENRESLARLYGFIYFQQLSIDKSEEYNRQALKYAIELNDTSLITMDLYNLGLCTSGKEAISNFKQCADLSQKSGYVLLQAGALEKLAALNINFNNYTEAQQLIEEAKSLCKGNSVRQLELALTQCRLWLAEEKYDAALQGYKSINTDSLTASGHWLRASAISYIFKQQGDYKNALVYSDSAHFYADSLRQLDKTKQVEEIERSYHSRIAQKNQRFQILMWSAFSAMTVMMIILFFVLKSLRLKKRQIELNDRIYALNARIAELIPNEEENDEQKEAHEDNITSISGLIEQKYELSLEVFKGMPQYESLKKLNLIREMGPENKAEIKYVHDAIVGSFSGCCSDAKQAFTGLTNDDCVFCTMNFVGCSKEVISASMGASEEALRRRKSRIKQKLPESIFLFFFSK